jgi:hypothetical protein
VRGIDAKGTSNRPLQQPSATAAAGLAIASLHTPWPAAGAAAASLQLAAPARLELLLELLQAAQPPLLLAAV